jgi:glycosyltransferase involved in cell wall biosynthesis
VIIPVWNRERKLAKCLVSVLDQTFSDYEVIVVDSASTDGTKSVINEFARKSPKVKYEYEPVLGIGRARYKGEISSTGKIVLMTDSDCEVPRDWIERMSTPILGGNFSVVQGMKHSISRKYWPLNVEREEHRFMRSFFERTGSSLVDTANFCIDRKVLKEVGYTDRKVNNLNDADLAARLFDNGYKVELVETSVGHNYPVSPFKLARILFIRGSVHSMMRKKYPGNPVFNHETIKLFFAYFLGLASEAFRMKKTFPYDLVSGISWRLGLLWGSMKKPRRKYP